RLQQEEHQGLPAADHLAHRDDGGDLEDGHHEKKHERHDEPSRTPAPGVRCAPYSRCHVGSRSDSRRPAARSGCARYCRPHTVMRCSDSRMMSPLILESPISRSTKVMGTSTTRSPPRTARVVRSTWKQYPWDATSCSPMARRAEA